MRTGAAVRRSTHATSSTLWRTGPSSSSTSWQERVPVNEKARAEQLVAEARQAIQEQAGLDRVRPLISDLQQVVNALPAAAAAGAPSGGNGANGAGDGAAAGADDEEVVDAEFTRE